MKPNYIVAPALAVLLCLAPAAVAQAPVPTNLPSIMTAAAPPAGFNPITASDSELAAFGFPPRPNAATEPQAYGAWQNAMLATQQRIVPQLEQTNLYHGPKQTGNATGTSYNWSGSVDFGGASSYNHTNSFYYLVAEYVVPAARQAYGVCNGGWDYSSSWVGIDGDGSNDVLQAGTESDAFCSGGSTSAFYSAWVEWFPYPETRVTNFPVAPGDDIFVEVWNTTATQGYAYFVNYRTGLAAEFSLTPPKGTTLKGNSAEWVVERPGTSSGLTTLTNYSWDFFANCYAVTWNGVAHTPAAGLQLTMLDNSGHPISYPTLLGTEGIWFRVEGSAY